MGSHSEPPRGTDHEDTLILKFWPPELQDNKCLLFKPQMGSFVTAALGDKSTSNPRKGSSSSRCDFSREKNFWGMVTGRN